MKHGQIWHTPPRISHAALQADALEKRMNSARWRCRSTAFEARYHPASLIAGITRQGECELASHVLTNPSVVSAAFRFAMKVALSARQNQAHQQTATFAITQRDAAAMRFYDFSG